MITQHAISVFESMTLTTAKRANQLGPDWAEAHVAAVLGGGSSTEPATGSGSPLVGTVVWTHPRITGSIATEITTYPEDNEDPSATAARHAARIAELVQAIEDAGGTVTSQH